MQLKSSKDAEGMHHRNLARIKTMIARFKDPATSKEDRNRILEKLKTIIAHVDGKAQAQQESIFIRMVKFTNGKR